MSSPESPEGDRESNDATQPPLSRLDSQRSSFLQIHPHSHSSEQHHLNAPSSTVDSHEHSRQLQHLRPPPPQHRSGPHWRRYDNSCSSGDPSPLASSTHSPTPPRQRKQLGSADSPRDEVEGHRAAGAASPGAAAASQNTVAGDAQWASDDPTAPRVVRDDTHVVQVLTPQQEELGRTMLQLHSTMSLAESTSSPNAGSLRRVGSSVNAATATPMTERGAGGSAGSGGGAGSGVADLYSPPSATGLHSDPMRGLTPSGTPGLMPSPPLTSAKVDGYEDALAESLEGARREFVSHVHQQEGASVHGKGLITAAEQASCRDLGSPEQCSASPPIPLPVTFGRAGRPEPIRPVSGDAGPFASFMDRGSPDHHEHEGPVSSLDTTTHTDNLSFRSGTLGFGKATGCDRDQQRKLSAPTVMISPTSGFIASFDAEVPVRENGDEDSDPRVPIGTPLSPGRNARGATTSAFSAAATPATNKRVMRPRGASMFTVTSTATGSGPQPANRTATNSPATPAATTASTTPTSAGAGTPSTFLPRVASAAVVSASAPGPMSGFAASINNLSSAGSSVPRYAVRRHRRPAAPPIDLSRSATTTQLDRSQSLSNFGTPVGPMAPLQNASGGVVPTVPAFHHALGDLPRASTSTVLYELHNSSLAGASNTGMGVSVIPSSARSSTSLMSGRSHRGGGTLGTSFMGGGPPARLQDMFPDIPDSVLIDRDRIFVPRDVSKQLGKGAYGEVVQGELYPPDVKAPTNPETELESFMRGSRMTTPRVCNGPTFTGSLQQLPLVRNESGEASCTALGVSPTKRQGSQPTIPVQMLPYSDATAGFYNGGVYTTDKEQLSSMLLSPNAHSRSTSMQLPPLPSPSSKDAMKAGRAARMTTVRSAPIPVARVVDGSWDTDAVLMEVTPEVSEVINQEEADEDDDDGRVLAAVSMSGGSRQTENLMSSARGNHQHDGTVSSERVRGGGSPEVGLGALREGELRHHTYSPPFHSVTVAPVGLPAALLSLPTPNASLCQPPHGTGSALGGHKDLCCPGSLEAGPGSAVAAVSKTCTPHSLVLRPEAAARVNTDLPDSHGEGHNDTEEGSPREPASPLLGADYLRTKRRTRAPNAVLELSNIESSSDDDDDGGDDESRCEIDFPAAVPATEAAEVNANPDGNVQSRDSLHSADDHDDEDEHTMNYQSPTTTTIVRRPRFPVEADDFDDVDSPLHDRVKSSGTGSFRNQKHESHRDSCSTHMDSPLSFLSHSRKTTQAVSPNKERIPSEPGRHTRRETAEEPFGFDVVSSGEEGEEGEESDLEVVGSSAPTFGSPAGSLITGGLDSRRPSFTTGKVGGSAVLVNSSCVAGTTRGDVDDSQWPVGTDVSSPTHSPEKPRATLSPGRSPMSRSPDSHLTSKPTAALSLTEAPAFHTLRSTGDEKIMAPECTPTDRSGTFSSGRNEAHVASAAGESSGVFPFKSSMPSLQSTSTPAVGDAELNATARAAVQRAAEEAARERSAQRVGKTHPLHHGDADDHEGATIPTGQPRCASRSQNDGEDDTSNRDSNAKSRNARTASTGMPHADPTGGAVALQGLLSPAQDFGQTISTDCSLGATNNTFNMSWTNRIGSGGMAAPHGQMSLTPLPDRPSLRTELAEFRSTTLGDTEESGRATSHELQSSFILGNERSHHHVPTVSNITDAVAAGAIPFRSVAVKTFYKSKMYQRENAQSFHNEMIFASQLRHPCLVNVYGIAEEVDKAFIVMDLAEKGNVDQYIKKFGIADAREMAPRFAADVVLLLEYFRDGRRHPFKPRSAGVPGSVHSAMVAGQESGGELHGSGSRHRARRIPLRGNQYQQHVPPVQSTGSEALVLTTSPESHGLVPSEGSSRGPIVETPVKSSRESTAQTPQSASAPPESAGFFARVSRPTSDDKGEEEREDALQMSHSKGADLHNATTLAQESSIVCLMPTQDHLRGTTGDAARTEDDDSNESDVEKSSESSYTSSPTSSSSPSSESLPVLSPEEQYKSIVVHRDIKPENMLLTWDYHVKLGDFGSGCFLGDEEANRFVGTAAYMAPEVTNDSKAGPYTDLWSLGCVIYELVVGYPAFYGNTTFLISRHIKRFLEGTTPLTFAPPPTAAATGGAVDQGSTTESGASPAKPTPGDDGISEDARDIILCLLKEKPEERLGAEEQGGFAALRAHPFFRTIDWSCVLETPNITPTNTDYTEELIDFLETDEKVAYCSPVDVLKDSTGLIGLGMAPAAAKAVMFSRRSGYSSKVLVLTDAPRLFLVDPASGEEAFTIPWSRELVVTVERMDFFAVTSPICGHFHFHDRNRRADLWGMKLTEQVQLTVKSPEPSSGRRSRSVDTTGASCHQRYHPVGASRSQLSISLANLDRDLQGSNAGSVPSHNGLLNRLRLTPRSTRGSQPRSSRHHSRSNSYYHPPYPLSASATTPLPMPPAALTPPPMPGLPAHRTTGASLGSGDPTGGAATANTGSSASACALGCVTDCTGRPQTARTTVTTPSSAVANSRFPHTARSPSTITVTVASTSHADTRLTTPTALVSPSSHTRSAAAAAANVTAGAHIGGGTESSAAAFSTTHGSPGVRDPQTPLGSSFSTDGSPFDDTEDTAVGGGGGGRTGLGASQPPVSPPLSVRTPTATTAFAAGKSISPAPSLGPKSVGGTPRDAWNASTSGVGIAGGSGGGGGGGSCASEGLTEYADLSPTPRQPSGTGGLDGSGLSSGAAAGKHFHTFSHGSSVGTPYGVAPLSTGGAGSRGSTPGGSVLASSDRSHTGPQGGYANVGGSGGCASNNPASIASASAASTSRSAVTKKVFEQRKRNRGEKPQVSQAIKTQSTEGGGLGGGEPAQDDGPVTSEEQRNRQPEKQ